MGIIHKIKNFHAEDKQYFFYMRCKKYNLEKLAVVSKVLSDKRMKRKSRAYVGENSGALYIETPDGFSQTVHPDVIKHDEFKYVMAVTPYPFGDDKYENPVIYKSDDLNDFQYIAGPLDYPAAGRKNHLSDASLVVDDGAVACYYRECIYSAEPQVTNIYRRTSHNLKDWSERELVFSAPMSVCDIISPKVLNDEHGWRMYTCVKKDGVMLLAYVDSPSVTEEKMQICSINNMPEGKMLWHLSAVNYGKGDIMILALSDDLGGTGCELYIGWKNFGSDEITILKKADLKNGRNNIKLEYRADGIIDNGVLKIICSVQFEDKTWGCVLIEEGNVEVLLGENNG